MSPSRRDFLKSAMAGTSLAWEGFGTGARRARRLKASWTCSASPLSKPYCPSPWPRSRDAGLGMEIWRFIPANPSRSKPTCRKRAANLPGVCARGKRGCRSPPAHGRGFSTLLPASLMTPSITARPITSILQPGSRRAGRALPAPRLLPRAVECPGSGAGTPAEGLGEKKKGLEMLAGGRARNRGSGLPGASGQKPGISQNIPTAPISLMPAREPRIGRNANCRCLCAANVACLLFKVVGRNSAAGFGSKTRNSPGRMAATACRLCPRSAGGALPQLVGREPLPKGMAGVPPETEWAGILPGKVVPAHLFLAGGGGGFAGGIIARRREPDHHRTHLRLPPGARLHSPPSRISANSQRPIGNRCLSETGGDGEGISGADQDARGGPTAATGGPGRCGRTGGRDHASSPNLRFPPPDCTW